MPKIIEKNQKPQESYDAKDIYVLEGLDPVRKRPGMYIGSTGTDGLHHLIWECVDNSIDEAMGGYAKNIEVRFLPQNRVLVKDDGRGIPVDIHPHTKKSALETVICTLHAGGKFGGESYKISAGLHGVGISVVNALSSWMRAEVCRSGKIYSQEYSKGKPITKVKESGKCNQTGTTIIFEPDVEIFKEGGYNLPKIITHLRQQAYLTPGVKISIYDERKEDDKTSFTFYFEGGIVTYLRFLNRGEKLLYDNIFYAKKDYEGILVEVAIQYIEDSGVKEMGLVNNIHTPEGGMHLTGFKTALTRVLNDYSRKNGFLKESEENLSGEDVREGLSTIIALKIREPQFEGQTKAKLGNPEARTATEAVVSETFFEYLEKNPNDSRKIIEKCLLSQKARKAAKAARETVLRKGVFEGMVLPGKLADCSNKEAEESELFIVEGDSAGGSAKMGRDRRFQAILPLKGKILNVEKSRLDKILAFEEIKALILALGTAIGEEFDVEKLRYHRIIIATDADPDGAHIRTLLLTLFFRYFPILIERGHIYIAQPPLYKIQIGKNIHYAYNDDEKEKVLAGLKEEQSKDIAGKKQSKKKEDKEENEEEKIKGLSIQRYKGLGEMNPEQLWETTMNPANRTMRQVNIEDAVEADRIFDILMGSEVVSRKKFIQTHAKSVKNLDF